MKKAKLLIGLLVCAAATSQPAIAKSGHFTFRDHVIGEPIEKNFPYWAEGYRGLDLPYCSQEDNGVVACDDPTIETKANGYSQKLVGDVPVIFLQYRFYKGRLYAVWMLFNNGNLSKIEGMLEGKYGKPSETFNKPVTTKAGVNYDSTNVIWKFAEGDLYLTEKYTDIDTAGLIFEDPKVAATIEAADKAKAQEKGQSAF